MHIDAHYVRGRTHTVCQDYAVTGPNVAVVCDGCSSAPHSDVGARLLAHAALTAEPSALDSGAWLRGPDSVRETLALPASALDATCIVARALADAITVTMFGDGVIAARGRDDGPPLVIEVAYPRSAPPYPSYTLDADRLQAYEHAGLGAPRIVASHSSPTPVQNTHGVSWHFARSDWSAVLVGSDGLTAFEHEDRSAVPTEQVIGALFRYPSPHGAFVTRRLRRFVQREAPAAGIVTTDDVAVAAVCWEAA